MLVLQGKTIKAERLPASGTFPGANLVTVLDHDSGDTLRLACRDEVIAEIEKWPQLTDVTVQLSCQLVDLKTLGGQGRAYRLRLLNIRKGATGGQG